MFVPSFLRKRKLTPEGARTWLLMVPLHMLAFLALYLGAARMMRAGFIDTSAEAAKMLMETSVSELAVVTQDTDPDVRQRFLERFLNSHQLMRLDLLDPRGQPILSSTRIPDPDTRSGRTVERILAGEINEDYWMETSNGVATMLGFKKLVSQGRCSSCHFEGEGLGIATVAVNMTEGMQNVQDRLQRNLVLLIVAWAGIFGLTTAWVRRSAERSAIRLASTLSAAAEGRTGEPEREELVLDPVTAALHRSLRDALTQQREREAEVASRLAHTDQLATLGGMAAGLAHEIKNPLAGIQGAVELLREDSAGAGADQGSLGTGLHDEILGEIKRVNGILQNLLEMARPAPPSMVRKDLRAILEDLQQLLSPSLAKAGVLLRTELPASPVMGEIDVAQLRQVLVNLINNAAEALDDEGTITLQAAVLPDGGSVVAVKDNGPGIPEDLQSRLFEPFFTTKFSGTGLGLAIARSLIEQQGGVIEVDSEVGEGSTFFIILRPEGFPERGIVNTETGE